LSDASAPRQPSAAGSPTVIGRLRLFYCTLASTNDLARDLARAGYPHGTAVIADYQTAGRGRQGRRWEAPPGSGLLCSLVLRPALPAGQGARLGMAAALAAADAIGAASGLPALLKWPNDILVPDPPAGTPRKVAGLLLETTLTGATVETAVLGIGVNLSSAPDLPTATHLARASGRAVARSLLLDLLMEHLGARLAALAEAPGADDLFAAWRARLTTLDQPVQVTMGGQTWSGVAEDVAADGALIVRDAAGRRRQVHAADVTLSHARLRRRG
jgi:BirA family biotin operon repressor/biotin-[acetyl-CoA-carboxylase] ligase